MVYNYRTDCEKEINIKIREIENSLGRGKAEDFAKYKEKVGYIAGLRKTLEILKNVGKAHGEEDDDE